MCRRRTLRHRKEQAVVQAVAQEVSHERKTPAALARSLRDSLIITCAIGVTHCGRRGLSEVGKRMEKGDKRDVRVDEIHPSESSTQLLGLVECERALCTLQQGFEWGILRQARHEVHFGNCNWAQGRCRGGG